MMASCRQRLMELRGNLTVAGRYIPKLFAIGYQNREYYDFGWYIPS